jgi:hypothetical protein
MVPNACNPRMRTMIDRTSSGVMAAHARVPSSSFL